MQELVAQDAPFGTDEYMLPTPGWAVYGAAEAGFDPVDVRFRKVRNHPGKAAAGGCT